MGDLERRIQQQQAKLKGLKAQLIKQARRDDTRRKIIYGAAALKLLKDFPGEKAERFQVLLDARVTRRSDRDFLGLSPLSGGGEREPANARDQA